MTMATRITNILLILALIFSDPLLALTQIDSTQGVDILQPVKSADTVSTSTVESSSSLLSSNLLESSPLSAVTATAEESIEVTIHAAIAKYYGGELPSGAEVMQLKEIKDSSGGLLYWFAQVRRNNFDADGVMQYQNLKIKEIIPDAWCVYEAQDFDHAGISVRKEILTYDSSARLTQTNSTDFVDGIRHHRLTTYYDPAAGQVTRRMSFYYYADGIKIRISTDVLYEGGKQQSSIRREFLEDGVIRLREDTLYHSNYTVSKRSTLFYANGLSSFRLTHEYDDQGVRLRYITEVWHVNRNLLRMDDYIFENGITAERHYFENNDSGQRTKYLKEQYFDSGSTETLDEYFYDGAGNLLERQFKRYADDFNLDTFESTLLKETIENYPKSIVSNQRTQLLRYWVDGTYREESITLNEGAQTVTRTVSGYLGVPVTVQWNFLIDVTPPTGSVQINLGASRTASRSVTLNLGAQDAGSGLHQMRISTNGGATWTSWQAFSVTGNATLSSGDGIKEVRVQVRDKAKNIKLLKDTIILDTVPPVLQDQNLATFDDVRKTIILGPLRDQDGDLLTYTYQASENLMENGQFVLFENQLTYLPNAGFTGFGTILVWATDGIENAAATLQLEIEAAALDIPNDPGFSSQYGLGIIDAVRAWNLSRGAGVNVAVIDSGMDITHPDLAGSIFTNSGEIAGNGVDDDGNGFIDDVHGWNFVENNNAPYSGSHGTHVAGILAATADNGIGIAGIASEVKMIPLRVMPDGLYSANNMFTNVANAINYAVGMGAKVINMSLRGLTSLLTSAVQDLMRQAVAAARAAGVILVAAAGNENADAGLYTPAAMEGVITVAATSSSNQRWTSSPTVGSNYGEEIEFAAPGASILSTHPAGAYAYRSGTSMATPLVAGLAAMMLSQDPNATETGILRRLKYSSLDLGEAGFDPYFGFGRINAFKALSYDYYDNGAIKTQWLESPDENGFTRLDFDLEGRLIGGAAAASLSGLSGLGASLAAGFSSTTSLSSSLLGSSIFAASVSEDQTHWDWDSEASLEKKTKTDGKGKRRYRSVSS